MSLVCISRRQISIEVKSITEDVYKMTCHFKVLKFLDILNLIKLFIKAVVLAH